MLRTCHFPFRRLPTLVINGVIKFFGLLAVQLNDMWPLWQVWWGMWQSGFTLDLEVVGDFPCLQLRILTEARDYVSNVSATLHMRAVSKRWGPCFENKNNFELMKLDSAGLRKTPRQKLKSCATSGWVSYPLLVAQLSKPGVLNSVARHTGALRLWHPSRQQHHFRGACLSARCVPGHSVQSNLRVGNQSSFILIYMMNLVLVILEARFRLQSHSSKAFIS